MVTPRFAEEVSHADIAFCVQLYFTQVNSFVSSNQVNFQTNIECFRKDIEVN